MARKKKEIEVNSTENIAYKTKVKIDFVNKKGKVVKSVTTHNTAGDPLFAFLLNCLRGNYYPGDRPKYAVVLYDRDYKALYDTTTATVPSINENNITITDSRSITYKVLIPNVLVKSKTIDGVALFSTNNISTAVKGQAVSSANYSMMINFDEETINDEYSVILSWQIVLSDQGYAQ